MNSISPDVRAALEQSIQAGATLSQIQTQLTQALAKPITYMEARFILDDLGLSLIEKEVHHTPILNSSPDQTGNDPAHCASSSVTVDVDPVQRLGTLASGRVTFKDGQSASWQIDEYGRLGIIPSQAGYRPSTEDMVEFQKRLQSILG